MARQSARGADDDRARHFEVTADASGEFVVRAVAAPECAHHWSSDMPRAGHEVPPRTPPDLAFLPAHVSIGRAEDCDAHLRALLGTLRRLSAAGWRVERQAPRDDKQASPEARAEETALGRDGARSRDERVERVFETERVPETEFPCLVRCSLPAPGGRRRWKPAKRRARTRRSRTRSPTCPPSLWMTLWMRSRGLFPRRCSKWETKGERGRERKLRVLQARPPPRASPGPSDAAATPAASTRSRQRSREAGEAAKTPWKTPTVNPKPTQQTTPYTEPRLTEDGVFSPRPRPSRGRRRRERRRGERSRGVSPAASAWAVRGGSGRTGSPFCRLR